MKFFSWNRKELKFGVEIFIFYGIKFHSVEKSAWTKHNNLLGIHTTFTTLVLQISMSIQLKNLVFVFKNYFILDLDKELHEVIACDVVLLPVVHSVLDHISEVFWNFRVYRS